MQAEARAATADEQKVLARWAGWGAVPQVFDEDKPRYATARAELRTLLDDAEYRAASRTTLNAHYTDADLVQPIWQAMLDAGFADTVGRVLEPGCGSGTFLGFSPPAATRLIGVELDPTTAAIAALLYPEADIRAQSFAHTRLPENFVDLTIGNVPFAKAVLHDPAHNPGRHSLHNHFILKSLHLTRPGGVVAVLTSHWTMDAENPAARGEIAELGELVHAVRLPTHIHQRAAGTSVITDLLILRRRQLDEDRTHGPAWERTVPIGGDDQLTVNVNEYFVHHPDNVLGRLEVEMGQFGPELQVSTDRDVDDRRAFAEHLQQIFAPYRAGERPALFQPDRSPIDGPTRAVAVRDAPAHLLDEHLDAVGDGTFTVVIKGQLHPHPRTCQPSRRTDRAAPPARHRHRAARRRSGLADRHPRDGPHAGNPERSVRRLHRPLRPDQPGQPATHRPGRPRHRRGQDGHHPPTPGRVPRRPTSHGRLRP